MNESMKETMTLAFRLMLICAFAAVALSQVDAMTRGPIAAVEAQAQREAVEAVLPAFAQLAIDTLSTSVGENIYYTGLQEAEKTGTAFVASTKMGYSGLIEVMVGVGQDQKISGVRILRHAETPGLGANYAAVEMLDRFFKGRDIHGDWKVTKDGGTVDAVTGATVTGRAIADAIATGLDRFATDVNNIKAVAPPVMEVLEESK